MQLVNIRIPSRLELRAKGFLTHLQIGQRGKHLASVVNDRITARANAHGLSAPEIALPWVKVER